jgi:polyhydroxybutyrate depolymerase
MFVTMRGSCLSLSFTCAVLFAVLLVAAPARAAARAPCDRPFTAGAETTLTLTSGGAQRVVVVYVPSSYDGHFRLPLILNLHGSQSTAEEQMLRSELARTAEQQRVIVAAPQGLLPAPPGFRWNVPGVTTTDPAAPDDEQFLSDVIDHLEATLCVDPRRIYGAGYSGGARMISQYACDHADRLAAIAPVAGLRAGVPVSGPAGAQPDPATCRPRRAVPIIAFAGTADPVNPYAGGGAAYWQYGTEAAQDRWAQLDDCHAGPVERPVAAHVELRAYRGCDDRAHLLLYRIEGGGHTWPGSVVFVPLQPALGRVTFEIDADKLMWSFFRRYRLADAIKLAARGRRPRAAKHRHAVHR